MPISSLGAWCHLVKSTHCRQSAVRECWCFQTLVLELVQRCSFKCTELSPKYPAEEDESVLSPPPNISESFCHPTGLISLIFGVNSEELWHFQMFLSSEFLCPFWAHDIGSISLWIVYSWPGLIFSGMIWFVPFLFSSRRSWYNCVLITMRAAIITL